ncbi:MAG: AraC family transcriptional regulator [Bacteroidales bacterium]|jgi:AraC-like DNA-binding protein/mannose-6-phosphate isomerase-like protein (cupin superfamily)|nr:AraC family transcriptional regulator [Bacteroidales bacterium]
MKHAQSIPIYSLQNFSKEQLNRQFQVETFDANRHFAVEYPHRHDFFEILFLSQGSGKHIIDSNVYEVKPPCVFFLSPGQAHKIELSEDIEGYIFTFTADFYLYNHNNHNRLLEFPFFFTVKQNNPPLQLVEKEDTLFLTTMFVTAIQELHKDNHHSPEMLRSLLDVILQYCNARYEVTDTMLAKGKGHILVKRFFQLLEENYQSNTLVNDYASQLNITPNHLTQTIKELTGKTASNIIQEKQLLEIKRLLTHTNLTVTEISALLNFSDQSYFTKFFKKMTGETPLAFRTKSTKNA